MVDGKELTPGAEECIQPAAPHKSPAPSDKVEEQSFEDQREGRFYGPDVSWRFYTRAERELAASLDQIENNNLSAHLYNAHQVKRRLYRQNAKPWESKRRWIAREEVEAKQFTPDANWTAWPLRPSDVPRSDEAWGVPVNVDEDGDSYRCKESWGPGLQLRDWLQAEILRQAKERLKLRTFVMDEPEQERKADVAVDTSSTDESSEQSSSSSSEASEEGVDFSGPDDGGPLERICRPMMISDDDVAAAILQPAAGHMLAQCDAVLLGLHRSRAGHRTRISRSRSALDQSRARLSETNSKSRPSTPHIETTDDDVSAASDHALKSRASSVRSRRGRQALGTRDWSEVLGIASLIGVDQSVIERTRRRCAALFDENMEFRVMSDINRDQVRDEVVKGHNDSLAPVEDAAVGREIRQGHPCPHLYCTRNLQPYPQLWRLREHLKRKHKHDADTINAMVDSSRAPVTSRVEDASSKCSEKLQDDASQGGRPHTALKTIHEEFLQPILINLGRSKDRRLRRRPSRESQDGGRTRQDNHGESISVVSEMA